VSSVAKYGRYVHLEKMLQGSMRVTPASEYKSASMTAAQQDDELKKSSQMPPTTTIGIRMPDGKFAQAETIGRVTKTTEIRRTFYMTSFTERCFGSSGILSKPSVGGDQRSDYGRSAL
jgi:acetylglutamate kinase